jgi:hypothetical protein
LKVIFEDDIYTFQPLAIAFEDLPEGLLLKITFED